MFKKTIEIKNSLMCICGHTGLLGEQINVLTSLPHGILIEVIDIQLQKSDTKKKKLLPSEKKAKNVTTTYQLWIKCSLNEAVFTHEGMYNHVLKGHVAFTIWWPPQPWPSDNPTFMNQTKRVERYMLFAVKANYQLCRLSFLIRNYQFSLWLVLIAQLKKYSFVQIGCLF